MRILQLGSFFYHVPWFCMARRWARSSDIDAVVITGNMCSMVRPRDRNAEQCLTIKNWLSTIHRPIYWAPGPFDPEGISDWDIPNLNTCGDYIQDGWRIHVMSAYQGCDTIEETTSQTIIVSHDGPALAKTTVGIDGTSYGRADVRCAVEAAGDCRLVLHGGGAIDPLAYIDACEGATAVTTGLGIYEVGPLGEAPSFALLDTATRSLNLHNGRRLMSHSFAR